MKKFDDTEIEKCRFHQYKRSILINIIHVNKMVVSNKICFGKNNFKYFIDYKDAKKIKPLCIFLPEINEYRTDFDKTKCMYFWIKDEKLLEKYNEIWKKVSNIIKKEFESNPACNEKYIKTKKRSDNENVNTNLHNNKMPKEGSQCICLSVILFDSVSNKVKTIYPQVFLEECQYVVKEKKRSSSLDDEKIVKKKIKYNLFR